MAISYPLKDRGRSGAKTPHDHAYSSNLAKVLEVALIFGVDKDPASPPDKPSPKQSLSTALRLTEPKNGVFSPSNDALCYRFSPFLGQVDSRCLSGVCGQVIEAEAFAYGIVNEFFVALDEAARAFANPAGEINAPPLRNPPQGIDTVKPPTDGLKPQQTEQRGR